MILIVLQRHEKWLKAHHNCGQQLADFGQDDWNERQGPLGQIFTKFKDAILYLCFLSMF